MTRSRAASDERGSVRGFTLIEVALALMILGGSLVILLGLQSSIIQRTIRDTKKQRAMLLAREVLATIESDPTPPVPQSTDGSVADVLDAIQTTPDPSRRENPEDREFIAKLDVTLVGIPNVAPDAMRKVVLTISWGPTDQDQFTTVYFTQSG